jgi:hypothetical protein
MSKTIEFNVFKGSESGDVNPDTIKRTIQPSEVFVEISHAGLCGTDRLFKNKGIALGHEGAGTVRDVGSAVTTFKAGDKVGFGWVRKVCGYCDCCVSGMYFYLSLTRFRQMVMLRCRPRSVLRGTRAVWQGEHRDRRIRYPRRLAREHAGQASG